MSSDGHSLSWIDKVVDLAMTMGSFAMKLTLISFSLAVVALTLPQTPLAHHGAVFPDLYEASVLELQQGLDGGSFSSVDLVKVCYSDNQNAMLTELQAYFARIDEVNLKGPALRAVIETNPSALSQAACLDKERSLTGKRSLLHGIPVLLNVPNLCYI